MKYGHKRTGARPKGLVHHSRIVGEPLTMAELPNEVFLFDVIDDQGNSSECTGEGYGRLAELWARAAGQSPDKVSARGSYTLGRMLELVEPFAVDRGVHDDPPLAEGPQTDDPALSDVGADPAFVIEGMRRFGVLAEKAVPHSNDPRVINERLNFFELEEAAMYRVDRIAFLDVLLGEDLQLALMRCLAAKCPVGFAMPVTQAYENAGRAIYDGDAGRVLGNHAQRISGYTRVNGRTIFRVSGSWGTGVGDNGYFWVTGRYLGSGTPFDFACCSFAPVVRAA